MTLTDKLTILMRARGLTRGTLAEATGIPYNTIVGFYTKGYRNMKLSNLLRLAGFFDVSLDVLCDDGRDLAPAPAALAAGRYAALSPESRDIVNRLIDGLTGLEQAAAPAAETEGQEEE